MRSPEIESLQARVRAQAALALAGQVMEVHSVAVTPRRFGLTVRTPSFGTTLNYDASNRRAIVVQGGRSDGHRRGATLLFPSDRAALQTFSGNKGVVLPIPTSLSAGRVLRAFRQASAEAMAVLSGRAEGGGAEAPVGGRAGTGGVAGAGGVAAGGVAVGTDPGSIRLKTILLLRATLEGVCVVAENDLEVAAKAAHIEEGAIEVAVENDGSVCAYVERCGAAFHAGWGRPSAPRARLEFRDIETAHAVLSGAVAALEAVADGRVAIRGRLPMVQNTFPMMDRLSDLLGKEEARR